MQAVLTAFAVLEHVAAHQPIGVSDVARSMDLPKSTAQRMLKTLETAGWVRPRSAEDPRWILTPRVLSVGARVGDAEALRTVAAEPMRILGQRTGETVHLTVHDGAEMILIAKVPSIHAVQPLSHIGGRSPVHATAGGKAVLAALAPADRALALRGGLPVLTPNTIADRAALDAELAGIRERGWAINHEEYLLGVSSVGAAICAHGRPLGAITVSVPTMRLDDALTDDYGRLSLAAVRDVERALDAAPAPSPPRLADVR